MSVNIIIYNKFREGYNDNMDCTQLSAIYMDLPRPYYHCNSVACSFHNDKRNMCLSESTYLAKFVV